VECIGYIFITPHGMFAHFFFQTSLPGLAGVEVGTKPPGPGPAFKQGDVVSVNFAGSDVHHETDLQNLVPGTTYHYIISAFDTKGNEARVEGTFTTLVRKVTVNFITIHLEHSAFEPLGFDFERFGWLLGEYHGPAMLYSNDFSNRPDGVANITSTVYGHKEEAMTLGVFGANLDCAFSGALCRESAPNPIDWGLQGKDDNFIWNTATTQVHFGDRGAMEEFNEDYFFATPPGSNPDLQFTVFANVQVSYVTDPKA
jgi:hypothetical protein